FSHTVPENMPKPFFYVPLYIRFFTFLKAIPIYFGILLWPFSLYMEKKLELSYSLFEPQTFLGFLVILILVLVAIKIRKKERFLAFSLAWFFIAIFPNSNIIPINALIYEHWLYLPSIGFFIIMAWVLTELYKKGRLLKYIALLFLIVIPLFYIFRTIERNKDWHDPVSFYESTIKYNPDSARIHNNLAMAYVDEGKLSDAIKEYKEAIRLGDNYPQPHYNLSNIYIKKGDYFLAIKELKRSLEIDNNFLYSHENLAIIYFNQDKFDLAKKEALFVLDQEPRNKIARQVLDGISKKREFYHSPQNPE
ncbi:tetratricopeptide repeat protein, partial [Candidatus Omnitrophota bacterium]